MKYTVFILVSLYFNGICSTKHRYSKKKSTDRYMEGHVVHGVDVPISMYPYVVTLTFHGFVYCSGSIIDDRIVLTAAHCIVGPDEKTVFKPSMMTVVAGATYPDEGRKHSLCNMAPHPKYSNGHYFYDIGLIAVREKFQYGTNIQKVPIAQNEDWKTTKHSFIMAGFGTISTKGSVLPKSLQATRLSYVNTKTCEQSQKSFNVKIRVPEHGFCLIGERWTGDCFGDSGSGVLWKRKLVGVVSIGRDLYCGSDMTPSMFTNAVYFRKWIREQSKKLLSSQKCAAKGKPVKHISTDYYFSSEEDD